MNHRAIGDTNVFQPFYFDILMNLISQYTTFLSTKKEFDLIAGILNK